jgi:vacuolar protein sorting-associated protein VTA1
LAEEASADKVAANNAVAIGSSFPVDPPSLIQPSSSGSGFSQGLPVPVRHYSSGSGAWSTAATPGVRDEDESRDGLGSGAVSRPNADAVATGPSKDEGETPSRRGPNADRKNVRFAGPDGVPLSPAETFVSMDSYVAPLGPPPTVLGEDDAGKQIPSVPKPTPGGTETRIETSDVPKDLPSTPMKMPLVDKTPPAPPPSPPAATPAVVQLDTKSIERCQKHCKWAISALDYEDLETARSELRKALAMLGE